MECGKLERKQYVVDVNLNKVVTDRLVEFDPKTLPSVKLAMKSNLFVLTADEVTVEESDHIIYDDVAHTYRSFKIPKPRFKNPRMLVTTHNKITDQLEQAVAGALLGVAGNIVWKPYTTSRPTVTLTITATNGAVYTLNSNITFALFDPNSNVVTWVMIFIDQSSDGYTTQSVRLSSNAFADANPANPSGCPCGFCLVAIRDPILMAEATVSVTKQASQTLVFVWTIQIQLPPGSTDGGLFTYYAFLWYWVSTGTPVCIAPQTWSITVIQNGSPVNYKNQIFLFVTPDGHHLLSIVGYDTNLGNSYTVNGGYINLSNGKFPVSINYTKPAGSPAVYWFAIGIQQVGAT